MKSNQGGTISLEDRLSAVKTVSSLIEQPVERQRTASGRVDLVLTTHSSFFSKSMACAVVTRGATNLSRRFT